MRHDRIVATMLVVTAIALVLVVSAVTGRRVQRDLDRQCRHGIATACAQPRR